MKKKYTVIATIIILAIAGGVYVWQKSSVTPPDGTPSETPEKTPEGSFVKFEVPDAWELQQYNEKELVPASLLGEPTPTKAIPVYLVKENASVILKGTVSPDVEKLEVTWIPTRTKQFVAPQKDWVTLPVENFFLGDTTWEFKAELYKNLHIGNSVQHYTVVGTTKDGTKAYDHLLFIKFETDADRAFIKAQQDGINKTIIEEAKGFAGDLEMYMVDKGKYASAIISGNISAHILWYSKDFCNAHSNTFLEMTKNCDPYAGGFVVVYDKEKQKNYYLGAYEELYTDFPDLSYDSTSNTLQVGRWPFVGPESALAEPGAKPIVIDTINFSQVLKD